MNRPCEMLQAGEAISRFKANYSKSRKTRNLDAYPMTNHIIPVDQRACIETFSFEQHVKYSKDNNLADYSGGSDWAPYDPLDEVYVNPSAEFKIIFAGWNDKTRPTFGYGVCIRGDCGDGDVVVLGHLKDGTLGYGVGAVVRPGIPVGLMGWTGNVRPQGPHGKHVHWGVKRNGVYINPMSVLGAVITLPVEPPVTPPLSGKLVRVMQYCQFVGVRLRPEVINGSLLKRIAGTSGYEFEFIEEVDANGRMWTRVACYIASEFMEPVK